VKNESFKIIQQFGFLLYTIYHFIRNLWKIVKDFLHLGEGQARDHISNSSGTGINITKTIVKVHFLYVPLNTSCNFTNDVNTV